MDITPLSMTPTPNAAISSANARPSETSEKREARIVAEDFEAFFISMYLDTMFSGIETDGLLGGGHAETIYRSLFNQEAGKAIAKTGGIGIADSVMREILKMQETL